MRGICYIKDLKNTRTKLDQLHTGPFIIIEKKTINTYTLKHMLANYTKTVHRRNIVKLLDTPPLGNWDPDYLAGLPGFDIAEEDDDENTAGNNQPATRANAETDNTGIDISTTREPDKQINGNGAEDAQANSPGFNSEEQINQEADILESTRQLCTQMVENALLTDELTEDQCNEMEEFHDAEEGIMENENTEAQNDNNVTDDTENRRVLRNLPRIRYDWLHTGKYPIDPPP